MRSTLLVVALLLVKCRAADAQTAGPTPAFEVASVKTADIRTALQLSLQGKLRLGMTGGPGTNDPGRFICNGVKLSDLILRAYAIKHYQLTGPAWLESEFYDIVAKVPEGASKQQFAMMMQDLLEKRFKLTVHTAQKEMPTFDLTVGKGGPRLTESVEPRSLAESAPSGNKPSAAAPAKFDENGYPIIPPGATYRMAMRAGQTTIRLDRTTMDQFVQQLTDQNLLGRPVIDATDLRGMYDITLHYIQGSSLDFNGVAAPGGLAEPGDTLANALQTQLGLKLEPKKAMIEVFVVDHVEKVPTEN